MLTNDWAIVFNLFSSAFLGLVVSMVLLLAVWFFISDVLMRFSATAQKLTLWSLVVMPWMVSITCMMFFSSSFFQFDSLSKLDWLAHWHHPYAFEWNSWHGVKLYIFMLAIAYILTRKLIVVVRHLNAVQWLTRLSQVQDAPLGFGEDIVVVKSRFPSAFTAGMIKPKCYLTTSLVEQVSESELNMIIAHERAHIRHKDNWKKMLFALLASLFPRSVSGQLNRMFTLVIEKIADAAVGSAYSRLDIAQTLVKTARLQRAFLNHPKKAGLVSYFVADDLDTRVRFLVDPPVTLPFPWIRYLIVMASISLFSAIGADVLHHLFDVIFSH